LGEKHGDGTWYFPSGSVRYEGNYIDGVWEGEGTSYYESGSKDY